PDNIIGGANDYQLGLNLRRTRHGDRPVPGPRLVRRRQDLVRVPAVLQHGVPGDGRPSVAFDDAGHAYYATLGFGFVGPANATNPDVLVLHSADGGKTLTAPTLISGPLDEAFVSVPTITSDGRIFVAFMNTTDLTSGRDDYEVVQVDPTTGAALGDPVKVATVIDGFTDYPIAFGRQTYQDSVFRSWAAGNIAA